MYKRGKVWSKNSELTSGKLSEKSFQFNMSVGWNPHLIFGTGIQILFVAFLNTFLGSDFSMLVQ